MHSEGAIVCHVIASHSPLGIRSGIKTCNVQYCHLLSPGEREKWNEWLNPETYQIDLTLNATWKKFFFFFFSKWWTNLTEFVFTVTLIIFHGEFYPRKSPPLSTGCWTQWIIEILPRSFSLLFFPLCSFLCYSILIFRSHAGSTELFSSRGQWDLLVSGLGLGWHICVSACSLIPVWTVIRGPTRINI